MTLWQGLIEMSNIDYVPVDSTYIFQYYRLSITSGYELTLNTLKDLHTLEKYWSIEAEIKYVTKLWDE